MHKLRIKLNSPLCSGSGLAYPGYVDRDVVFDEFGLPHIPGRRLKGLLREGYEEVHHRLNSGRLAKPDDVFGKAGGGGPGAVSVEDAVVEGAKSLRRWLEQDKQFVSRSEVIAAFTEVRRQTAMDRKSGAPLKNTLRATRVVRKGLEFLAPVICQNGTPDAIRQAARAMQFMGVGRTRGLGHVTCTLEDCSEKAKDQTAQKFEDCLDKDKCAIGVRITLRQPVVFPNLEGDPNAVFTDGSIPGTAIHGLLAQRFLSKFGATDDFHRILFSGDVQFLAATPRIQEDSQSFHRSAATPCSIRELKASEGKFIDLVVTKTPEPIRRVKGWYAAHKFAGPCALLKIPESTTAWNYHHQRARDNRIGRAVGEKAAEYGLVQAEAGAFFGYGSLEAGQVFCGEIRGKEDDLKALYEIISGSETDLKMGRSRSAQYGGVTFEWTKPEPVAPEAADNETLVAGALLAVTLLSPVIGVNEHGHAAPEFPWDDFQKALGNGIEVERPPKKAFVRHGWQGAYFSHQGLPRQQMPVLQAGSVFVASVKTEGKANLKAAQEKCYGLRTEEGFGRVMVVKVPDQEALSEIRLLSPAPTKRDQVKASKGSPEWNLATDVFRRRLIRRAVNEAVSFVDRNAKSLNNLPNHLLSRVLSFLDRDTLATAASALSELGEGPKEKLRATWITVKENQKDTKCRLIDFLCRTCKTPSTLAEKWLDLEYRNSEAPWSDIIDADCEQAFKDSELEHAERVVRCYLRQVIREIQWRNRQKTIKQPKAEEQPK